MVAEGANAPIGTPRKIADVPGWKRRRSNGTAPQRGRGNLEEGEQQEGQQVRWAQQQRAEQQMQQLDPHNEAEQ
eukprot:gene18-313_t